MLNLNQPFTQSLAVEPTWKLLIFDGYGQDIISPLLNVKQLREAGVTLHMFVFFNFLLVFLGGFLDSDLRPFI